MPLNFRGTGTTYYGRADRRSDGSYIATEWIIFAYLPLIPLRSWRLRNVGPDVNLIVFSRSTVSREPVPLHRGQVRNGYLVTVGVIAAFAAFIWYI